MKLWIIEVKWILPIEKHRRWLPDIAGFTSDRVFEKKSDALVHIAKLQPHYPSAKLRAKAWKRV